MKPFTCSVALVAGLVPGIIGCSSGSEPEPPSRVGRAVTSAQQGLRPTDVAVVSSVAPVLAGYAHILNVSHFKIGQNTSLESSTPQIQRWRGSLGAFAIDPSNGSACAYLDASSPTGPYVLDEATHAANVKAYFVNAGLPPDQVGEIQATYQTVTMGGSITQPAAPPVLESINSIIRRRVSGVLVAESEAWAKMTTGGDVDMECVFWPRIDMGVVNTAVAFSKAMTDGSAHAAYLAKLPGTVQRDIGVLIHHSNMSVHAPATAYVSYDVVMDTSSSAAARHFDQSGAEFRLPHELAPTPGTLIRK